MSVVLSPEQRRIVEAPDGHYLVVASAGSGKTRILTERVRQLLEVRKIRSRVLAMTFTNKAAAEMQERLRDVEDIGERTFIGTIHSFCQTVIEAHGKIVGFETMPAILERENDRIAMLETAIDQSPDLRRYLQQHSAQERQKFLYGVLQKISRCKRDWDDYQAIIGGDWPNEREAQAFREYQDHLTSQGVIDFDDILLLALRVLAERPAIADIYQRTYRHLCVDEAQDLNSVQYSLIRILGEKADSVLLVGDPNQAIYGFNGSSHRFMMETFPNDFQVERIELRENYRSSRAVIQAANALYEESIELNNAALEGESLIVPCADEEDEADWVVKKITDLLHAGTHSEVDGTITLDRMVVLARNRYVFGPLQVRLETAGIDFHLRQPSGGAGLESDPGQVFDLGLRLLINPKNRLVVRELGRRIGAPQESSASDSDGIATLEAVMSTASPSWASRLPSLLQAWRTLSTDVNRFTAAMQVLESAWSGKASTKEDPAEEAAMALADLIFLREVWSNYTQKVARESRTLAQFRNQMATGEIVPHIAGKGLMLAPVHTVKGLEFDIVFVMGLVEGCFPDYRAVKSGGTALAEEKNDAFVAITRSKRFLYLTWPQAKFMPWDRENRVPQRQSRFLSAIVRGCSRTDPSILRVAEDSNPYGSST
jgi:DNA helicase II / ATP-dependent DNA helicase PcrA